MTAHDQYKALRLQLDGYLKPGQELHRNVLFDQLYASIPKDPQVKVQIYNAEIAPGGYTNWHCHNGATFFVALQGTFEAEFQEGILVRAKAGTPLGTAYVNPHTLICARLVSGDPEEPFGRPLIVRRLQQALGLRERLFPDPYYRLVYGEGDFLPGLIVDRYGGVLVVQLNTAGMERAEAEVIDALMEVVAPESILLRNDSPARRIEGLDTHVRTASGVVPEEVALTEHGARFEVPLSGGQKTGWYYDHRENRERMLRYAGGARVLDAFSYLGAWGIEAAVAGAERVVCIESSPIAAASISRHAAINQVADRVEVLQADVFDTLKAFDRSGARFDLVVLDPPAFIKRRKDVDEGSSPIAG